MSSCDKSMGSFEDRRILILGVANEKSIAYAVAEFLKKQGAEIALSYPSDAIKARVEAVAEKLGIKMLLPCDVQSDSDIKALFQRLENDWERLDGLVHAVAYAEREDFQARFCETSRDGFKTALDISAYSLIALSAAAEKLMQERGGSILTFSYLGAQRVIPNYKVMGVAKAALEAIVRYLAVDLGDSNIRVNAISAGPIRTLAASAIPQFKEMYAKFEGRAALKRNVELEDVARAAAFFLSPMSSGLTGEIQYVDCGFNIVGL